MNWFPILLVTHIILAVALLLPTVLLPFLLRRGDGRPGTVTRILMAMQGTGTLIIAAGLAITGSAMLWILGPELLTQPWLLVALALYAINLVIAAFIGAAEPAAADRARLQRRPTTRRGGAVRVASATSRTAWPASIGVIGFLMSTKPDAVVIR